MKHFILMSLFMTTVATKATEAPTLVRYQELISRTPDAEGKNVKVWTIRQNDTVRINVVEMRGELSLHKHPDAAHSLMVLEGSVKVQMGSEFSILTKGDFISIPADLPHKYWSLTPKSILVSMDAPYYRVTIPLE